jgi:hypothetical protein
MASMEVEYMALVVSGVAQASFWPAAVCQPAGGTMLKMMS